MLGHRRPGTVSQRVGPLHSRLRRHHLRRRRERGTLHAPTLTHAHPSSLLVEHPPAISVPAALSASSCPPVVKTDRPTRHQTPTFALQLDQIPLARKELHRLLEDRELATTPLLILANKIDLEPHISEPELIRELNLDYIVDNPWLVIPISALRVVNIDQVIQWLVKQAG